MIPCAALTVKKYAGQIQWNERDLAALEEGAPLDVMRGSFELMQTFFVVREKSNASSLHEADIHDVFLDAFPRIRCAGGVLDRTKGVQLQVTPDVSTDSFCVTSGIHKTSLVAAS